MNLDRDNYLSKKIDKVGIIDFDTWSGFGILAEWLEKNKEIRNEFIYDYLIHDHEWEEPFPWFIPLELLDPTTLANELCRWFKDQEEV